MEFGNVEIGCWIFYGKRNANLGDGNDFMKIV